MLGSSVFYFLYYIHIIYMSIYSISMYIENKLGFVLWFVCCLLFWRGVSDFVKSVAEEVDELTSLLVSRLCLYFLLHKFAIFQQMFGWKSILLPS